MKYKLLLLLWGYLMLGMNVQASVEYGLSLKSHSVAGGERTELKLDDGHPFMMKKDFTIDFQMMVRNEPDFGVILHLISQKKQQFHFVFAAGDSIRNYPALLAEGVMYPLYVPIERDKWIPVSLDFRLDDNKVNLRYADKDTTLQVPLQGIESLTASLGRFPEFSAEVAPVNIRDLKISLDGELVRHWKLGRHNGDLCLDELEKAVARAINPLWMVDSHIEWKKIYSEKSSERLDVAFNAREGAFYIVKAEKVQVLDGASGRVNQFPITGGHPAMEYSEHLVYDTLTNRLFSYCLHHKLASSLSVSTGRWSLNERHTEESRNYNHARTFNEADSSFYFFGGYGFYQYRNDLYKLNVNTGQVSEVTYEPALSPRYSAAIAVVGEELYVLGGRGNKQGKQEYNPYSYCELSAINLKTGKSRTVWETDNTEDLMLLASSMYFSEADSSFYAVNMKKKPVLWKVSMKEPVWTEVSRSIQETMDYQDCDFSFYVMPKSHKLYLVVDKILSDRSHSLNIYSLNTPLVGDVEIVQQMDEPEKSFSWGWMIGALVLLGGAVAFFLRRRTTDHRTVAQPLEPAEETVTEEPEEASLEEEQPEPEDQDEEEPEEADVPEIPIETFFDRSRSAISLLGTFQVRDRDGNDITQVFTPRLKNMFILLILHTEKNPQGILTKKITDLLWGDREDDAARNNRNVTVRKLRIVLEKVGDIELITDNGFMRIRWGEDVFCDYCTAMDCIRRLNQGDEHSDSQLLNKILEVLLYGPLLSNTIQDWLDDFKDAYSSMSIDLLRNLLEVYRENRPMVLRITDIMFRHDPLSEEALAAKCSVLYKQGKKGLARSVYDRFCKEYRETMGEECKTPFCDLYR